jgi:hypothetical protein
MAHRKKSVTMASLMQSLAETPMRLPDATEQPVDDKMVSSSQPEDFWPLEQYPALDPRCFQTRESFQTLRKPREELLQLPKNNDGIRLRWKTVSARDGAKLDVLCYEPQNVSSSVGLLVAIHGGGR